MEPMQDLDTQMENYSDETDEFMRISPKARDAIREIEVNQVNLDEGDKEDSPVEDGFEMMAKSAASSEVMLGSTKGG